MIRIYFETPKYCVRFFSSVIEDLGLNTVGEPIWHKFPGEGGITGLTALSESHLACHTYPEFQIATFNLYCCTNRNEWDWKPRLSDTLGATSVSITRITRGVGSQSTVEKATDAHKGFELYLAGGSEA